MLHTHVKLVACEQQSSREKCHACYILFNKMSGHQLSDKSIQAMLYRNLKELTKHFFKLYAHTMLLQSSFARFRDVPQCVVAPTAFTHANNVTSCAGKQEKTDHQVNSKSVCYLSYPLCLKINNFHFVSHCQDMKLLVLTMK